MSNEQPAAWPFELDHVQPWAYCEALFTKEECEAIVSLGKRAALKKATVEEVGRDDAGVRDSNVAWMYPCAEYAWIFERVAAAVTQVNNDFFKFDLYGMTEGFQFTEYNAPTGFYGKHTDSYMGIAPRKLSVTVQLSADEEYEGGELMLHYQKDPIKAPTEQGKAIVFPSYTLHEVKPVTKGTRYSLVCWVTGKPFR